MYRACYSILMKQFFTIVFVTLGVILVIIIIALAYLWFADPFKIRTMFSGSSGGTSQTTKSTNGATTTESADGETSSRFSPAQEAAMRAFGIDPASVPTSFTPAQETCFTGVLGAARVAEIKGGATPSAMEYYKAKSCL